MNFDASQVGVPFTRVKRITINYPDQNEIPSADIEQALAVKLADEMIWKLQDLEPLRFQIDLAANGDDPIPLVHPTTGAVIKGQYTTLNQAFMVLLAVIRSRQQPSAPEPDQE